jgi:hypothetical protein
MILLLNAIKNLMPYCKAKLQQLKNASLKFLIVVWIINLTTINGNGQTQVSTYDCIWKGEVIGSLYAEKTQNGNDINLVVSTAVKTRFIFEVAVETYASTTFKNGKLYAGNYVKNVNGSEKLSNAISLITNGYLLNSNSEKRFFETDAINNTSIAMYFSEPVNSKLLFSEMFLTYVPVICVEPGKYKIEMPDGSINYYYYAKGSLIKIEIHTRFFSVAFVLKPNTAKPPLTLNK